MSEELYEEGVVKEVKDGIALVILNESGDCSSCSAKAVCKSGGEDSKILSAKDPFGVSPGDKVRIAVKGKNVLTAAFLLYGLPLILFLAGIYAGMLYFKNQKELWGTVLGFIFITFYSVLLHFISDRSRNKNKFIPEIVFVNSKSLP